MSSFGQRHRPVKQQEPWLQGLGSSEEELMRTTRVRTLFVIIAAVLLSGGVSTLSIASSCCPSDAKGAGDKKAGAACAHGQSSAQKALAVLEALESGDASEIEKHVSADTYIQHNLAFPDGREALTGAIKSGTLDGTSVDVKRVFTDGDYVVTHSEYRLFGMHQVGFDVFRFENGLIVEHWDNLQSYAGPNSSDRTMLDGSRKPHTKTDTEATRALVESFVSGVLIDGDLASLSGYFDGDAYTQHNPGIGDGLSTLVNAIGSGTVNMDYSKLHSVHASGDFALAMSEGELNGEHVAFYDLFRVENGFIAEHWDVVQGISHRSEWANENGKF